MKFTVNFVTSTKGFVTCGNVASDSISQNTIACIEARRARQTIILLINLIDRALRKVGCNTVEGL